MMPYHSLLLIYLLDVYNHYLLPCPLRSWYLFMEDLTLIVSFARRRCPQFPKLVYSTYPHASHNAFWDPPSLHLPQVVLTLPLISATTCKSTIKEGEDWLSCSPHHITHCLSFFTKYDQCNHLKCIFNFWIKTNYHQTYKTVCLDFWIEGWYDMSL